MHKSHYLTISLSDSPCSILQVGMRQPSLIAAHFAAHFYRYAILSRGLGYVAASWTVA